MSVKVMSWVWEQSKSAGTDRLVLLAIADCASDGGDQAWPSMANLARKAGIDVRTAQRAVGRLVELGELTVTPNAGKAGANVYRINLTPGAAPPPRQGATPAERHPRQSATPALRRETPGAAPPEPSLNRPTPRLRRGETRDAHTREAEPRDGVERVCARLADRIEANGCNRPTITKGWRNTARLMLDKDGRTETQITDAIDWATADEFWRANILSMAALRKHYERLRLAAQRARAPANGRITPDQRVADIQAMKTPDQPRLELVPRSVP